MKHHLAIPLTTLLLAACSHHPGTATPAATPPTSTRASDSPTSQPTSETQPATNPAAAPMPSKSIRLASPSDYQVFQRQSATQGKIKIAGTLITPATSLNIGLRSESNNTQPLIPDSTL